MSFPKYPKYQDTGLTWLAEAPEHWRVIAPKRVMKSCSGGTLIKGECAAEPEEGLFPAFSASGQDVWVERADYSAPGIVLSAVGARCGKTFKADGEWGVVANTHCLFPEGNQSRDFFWYLTNREDWWETGGTAQPFVKVRETLARTWCLPPANEQGCISNFLDCETAKIDALIAEQQRLIELLQEKRQAVISHAVTKGLNPNAPMKDSGVEWLGEVPEHWEVMGLTKTIGPVVDYRGKTPTKCDEGTLLVTAKNIRNGEIDYTLSEEYVDPLEAEQLLQRGRPVIGDVLFTMNAVQPSSPPQ
jgi:type I restriction enzyme, S subunit